jgi:hypothetical protein
MRTISNGRCRYEMVLISQPPNAPGRISWILLRNTMAAVKKIYSGTVFAWTRKFDLFQDFLTKNSKQQEKLKIALFSLLTIKITYKHSINAITCIIVHGLNAKFKILLVWNLFLWNGKGTNKGGHCSVDSSKFWTSSQLTQSLLRDKGQLHP